MMFGYATNNTPVLMPLSIVLAHKITEKLAEVRKTNRLTYLRPDGKGQVTIEYKNGKPAGVHTVVVSTQHDDGIEHYRIKEDIIREVIKPVCGEWLNSETIYHVNLTEQFVKGGPYADSGLTGRKIIVDTYGGHGSHGGGCFSGKDPSKVDRSAAYAIGVAEPVSLLVDCSGTNKIPESEIEKLIIENFPLKPADIINELKHRSPIYRKTSACGHFGREFKNFAWEKCDKAEILRKEIL